MAIYCNPKINLLESEYSINEYIIDSIDEINILFEGVDFETIKNTISATIKKAIKWITEQASRFINFIKSFDIKNKLLRKQFKLYVNKNKKYLELLKRNYDKIDYDKIKDYKFDLYLYFSKKFETGVFKDFINSYESKPQPRYGMISFANDFDVQEILSGKSMFGTKLSDDDIKNSINEYKNSFNMDISKLYTSFINLSATNYDESILNTIKKKIEEDNIDEAKSILSEYISGPHDCITKENVYEIISRILLFITDDNIIIKSLTDNVNKQKDNNIKSLKNIEQELNTVEKYKKERIDFLIKEELKFINKSFEINLGLINFYIHLIHKYQQSYIKITKFLVSLAKNIDSDINESTIFDSVQLI